MVAKAKLKEILSRRLSLRDPRFILEKVGAKLSGSIVSDTFRGWDDLQRQKKIWDALEEELGSESVRAVGTLLAYTPDEWNY